MSYRSTLLALAAAASVSLAGLASASVISFDPDGAGPLAPIQAASFDILPGNSLSKNVLVNGSDQVGHTFTNLFQARLGNFLDSAGHVIHVDGLNDPASPNHFEITVAAEFDLTVTGLLTTPSSSTVVTTLSPTGANFIRLYYDNNNATAANDLTGQGFTDGTLILNATTTSATSNFTTNTVGTANFDQFGANDYTGTTTVTGIGGASIGALSVFTAPAFFGSVPLTVTSSTTNALPFEAVNPSATFFGTVTPDIGPVNGASGHPDIQFQADAVASFTAVPEPTALALLAGAPLFALARRRRV